MRSMTMHMNASICVHMCLCDDFIAQHYRNGICKVQSLLYGVHLVHGMIP